VRAVLDGGGAFESNLPLVIIDSFGERRIDSSSTTMVPSIGVFIDPGEDGRTSIFDTPDYAGRLGGRIRGQSSQGWAKKQYAIEFIQGDTDDSELFRANQLKDFDASIFGLPADSDWVLNGPYADKSQLNNYLTFNWSNEMGQYAPRTKLVEVFVNTNGDDVDMARDYRGTYVLLEKIKVNNDRVDIAGLDPSDSDGEAITGGYVWKKDKTGTEDLNIFTGLQNQEVRIVEPSCSNSGRSRETSLYTCESGEITDEQIKWLTDHLTDFEEALYGREFADPARGYAAYIDVDSWVDTWLLVEFTKNIDGFRLSTYYHKDRGGKIKQGPAWDYNLALGNANYLQGGNPEGWYGTLLSADQYPYWDRLFEDPAFEHKVQERWHELREGIWSTENLHSTIDAAVNLISDGNPNLDQPDEGEPSNPISRNFDRWSSGGYGTDQALLRFVSNTQDGAETVVLNHLSENILRNVNQYRQLLYPGDGLGFKPRYVAVGSSGLELVPLPDFSADEYQGVVQNPGNYLPFEYFVPGGASGSRKKGFPYTWNLLLSLRHFHIASKLYARPWYMDFYAPDHPSGALQVTSRIMQEFYRTAMERGKRPVLTIIPTGLDLVYFLKEGEWPYQPLLEKLAEQEIPVLNFGPALLARLESAHPRDIYTSLSGHFNERGNELLAEIFAQYLDAQAGVVTTYLNMGSDPIFQAYQLLIGNRFVDGEKSGFKLCGELYSRMLSDGVLPGCKERVEESA